ncbi:olfactory receptor 52N1-like [Macrochelys suwanniensis]
MYAIAILGNFTILFIVKMEKILHGPMYYFFCMLAVTDLVMSTAILPNMLATRLTNPVVAKIGLAMVLHGVMLILPYPFLLRQWSYCRTNIIPQPYCSHIAVVNLACGNTHVSSSYGLFVQFSVMSLDVIFIVVSYTQILRAIFSLPRKDCRHKTFGTCNSHLCAIFVFYIPGLFFVIYLFQQNVPLHFHVLIGNVYYLMPSMVNPIIYGVRTNPIRGRLFRLFTHKGT